MAADDKKTESAGKKVSSAFENVANTVGKSIPILGKFNGEIQNIGDAFTLLSKTGNVFNNDMLALRVAAANARVSLDEYSDVLKENGKYFSALGGSVSQGSKVFGDFSKAFFESNLTENLRQMGYTSKDLNELLALQITMQKSSTDTSVEGQMRTAKAAAELGMELDLISRLTGQSRKEQEEKLKKAAVDGQIEAKFRIIAAEQGETKAAEAKKAFYENLAKAEAMGQSQLFKEMFASGTATTREAQMSLGLFGEAARKVAESAIQSSQAQGDAAKESMERAKVANMENQKNLALMTIAATGVGDASKQIIKNIEINDTAYQGLKKFMEKTNDVTSAMNLQYEAIKKEQSAREPLTNILVTTQRTFEDIRAGLVTSVGKVIQQSGQRDETGKATGIVGKAQDLANQIPGGSQGKTNEQLIKDYLEKGANNIGAIIPQKLDEAGFFKSVKGLDKGMTGLADKAAEYFPKFLKALDEIAAIKNEKAKTRQGGSIGEAGQLFEDWGKGTLAELHGMEAVIRPDQLMNMAKGLNQDGASVAFDKMKNLLAGQERSIKGLDLSKITGDFKTTVSKVEITNWPKNLVSKIEVKGPPAKDAAKPAESKTAEPKPSSTKPPDAKQVTAKDATAEPKKILSKEERLAQFDAQMEEKFKKIGEQKGETAERQARFEYEFEKKRYEDLQKWREQELKIKIAGIREGTTGQEKMTELVSKQRKEAEKNVNDSLARIKTSIPETPKISKQTEITVNGKKVDPDSKEGKEALKQIEAAKASLENSVSGMLNITKTSLGDIAKANLAEIKNVKESQTQITVNGKKVDPDSKEGKEALKQIEAAKASLENSVNGMLNVTKTSLGDIAKANLAEIKNVKESQTQITVNGKDVDPKSKEGQAVIREMEASKARLESTMNSLMAGVVEKKVQRVDEKTTGGETEIRRKENKTDDAVKAQDELSKTMGVYLAKQRAMYDQAKEQLGPDAKFSDIRRTVNQSKEKQDLDNEFRPQVEALRKRIADGTTYDVEVRKQSFQETKSYAEQELKITRDNKSELRQVLKTSTGEEIKEAKIKAEELKSVIGKSVAGMSDDQIEKMLPKGTGVNDFYIDMQGKLQSFLDPSKLSKDDKADDFKLKTEQDYNEHWVKSRDEAAKKVLELEEKAAGQTLSKREQNELRHQKLLKEEADREVAVSAANIENYKKQSEAVKEVAKESLPIQGLQQKSVSAPQMGPTDPGQFVLKSYIDNATEMRKVNKDSLNEVLSLNQQEREAKKQKYQEEFNLAQKGFEDRENQLIEIEKRYEAEGKKGQHKHDEEFKRLEAEEKAFRDQKNKAVENLSYFKEVDDTKRRMERQGYDFEKELAVRKQDLSKQTGETIKNDIKEALPLKEVKDLGQSYKLIEYPQPKELEGSLAKAAESLNDHGKTTLKYAMRDGEELNAIYKDSAQKTLDFNKSNIEEKNKQIFELEEKGKTQELSVREKSRIEKLKTEIQDLEDRNKYREQEIAAYTIAEKARKGTLEESNQAMVKEQAKANDAKLEDLKKQIDITDTMSEKSMDNQLSTLGKGTAEITDMFAEWSEINIEKIGGMTDAAFNAQDTFMQEIESLFEIPVDAAAKAQEALFQEANELFEMPSEAAAQAHDAFMQEINGLFDIRDEFEVDGEGAGPEEETNVGDDYSGVDLLEDLKKQIPDSMAEDAEYAAGPGDASVAGFDHVADAIQEFKEQVPAMMEFSDDMRAGEDIKPIATGTDSMAEDAEYAAGPGDASVAGFDHVADAIQEFKEQVPA
ncbi:MAG: hypothetical protein KGO93_10165, partial [Cyanobacteria bacterium REEB446]|nr:hypothetical protein [Cyanobacteria bacterium REEB446]